MFQASFWSEETFHFSTPRWESVSKEQRGGYSPDQCELKIRNLFIYEEECVCSVVLKSSFSPCVLQNCLRSVLEHIAVYGQAVFRLQRFIDEVTGYSTEPIPPGSGSSHGSKKGSEPPFRTYQAFVWALNKYFTTFKEELTTIERELICNGK